MTTLLALTGPVAGCRRLVPRCTAAAPVRASGGTGDRAAALSATVRAKAASFALAAALTLSVVSGGPASARLEGVNKPELLPKGAEVEEVIDVAGFLTPSEEARITSVVKRLERDTGFRLRVLAQNYPETPGLAIRDYWSVDDNTVVFVADPNTGNILNFNVGSNVDLSVPQSFWSRLAGRYGTTFYWREQGETAAILNAVSAIDFCLREEPGRAQCASIHGDDDQMRAEAKSGPFGLF